VELPSIKRILREDVKEAPSWVNGLIDPLNGFMETVYQALNRNLTLTENVASFVKELTYTTISTYPTDQDIMKFQNSLKVKPTGVMLMQAYDKVTFLPPTGPVYIPWTYDGTQIIIRPITGLAADKTYIIRLAVF
jgi:hypothetical protein